MAEIYTIDIKIDNIAKCFLYYYSDDDETIYISNIKVKSNKRYNGYGNKILDLAERICNILNRKRILIVANKKSFVYDWYYRRGYREFSNNKCIGNREDYKWMIKKI